MADRPIFVVGTPRSGTTLTAKILGRHPRIFMPGETHYFDDVFSRSRQLGELSDTKGLASVAERLRTLYERYYEPEDQERIERMFPQPVDLQQDLQGCSDYGCVLDRFMSLQMQDAAKNRWGNNAPRDLFSFKTIRNVFPDAKFVVCIRDVRAFLFSYQGKWKVTGKGHVERLKKLYHPVVTSYLWKSSMRQIELLESLVPSVDRVIVRYEDLVSAPEDTVRDICKTIEEEFDPLMLEVTTHNSSEAGQESGIFVSSVSRWLTGLTPEEIAIGQNIAGKELYRYGYSRAEISPGRLRILGIWLATPIALWRALAANKDVRGPLIPYLARRVGSLLRMGR
jgi:hypothetical protein